MSKGKLEKIKNAIFNVSTSHVRSDFSVESRENKVFTVFGCLGIEEYGPTRISLYVRGGTVAFEGKDLICDSYTNVGSVVSGYVDNVVFSLSEVKR